MTTPTSTQTSSRASPSDQPVLSRFANDPIIRPLLDDFVKDLIPMLGDLHSALDAANWNQLSRLGHKLKGEAATYGYPDLAALASKLEERTAAPQPPLAGDVADLMRDLDTMTERVTVGLNA